MNTAHRIDSAVIFVSVICLTGMLFQPLKSNAQSETEVNWIRPDNPQSPAKWGIENGIVFSLWPTPVGTVKGSTSGPRGL